MTTVGDAINLTRHRLRETYRRRLNRLSVAVDTDDLELTLTASPTGITEGTLLGLGTELVYVLTVNVAALKVQVIRGLEGTVAQAHPVGTLVDIEPRFPDGFILDELRNELRAWGPDLFRVTTVTVAGDHRTRVSTLPGDTDVFAVLGAAVTPHTTDLDRGRDQVPVTLDRTTTPPTVHLEQAVGGGRTVSILLARPFQTTPFTTATSLEDDCGVPVSAVDVLAMGAAYRLLTEVPRTDRIATGTQRDGDEVPPGHITSVREALAAEHRRRLQSEQAKLRARYPVRMQ